MTGLPISSLDVCLGRRHLFLVMRPTSLIALLFAAALLVGTGVVAMRYAVPPTPLSVELDTPKLSMENIDPGLRAKPIYFTLAAVPYLKEHWTEWSEAFGASTPLPEELAIQFDPTAQSPEAWRALDRKWRFGTLLLTGDPAGFRPLLDHLRQSPDWTLTRLDPTSLVYERSPAKAWTTADLAPLLAAFQSHSAEEQKIARRLIAHRLMFLGEMAAARSLLEETLKADPKAKEAWTELASLHGMQGQWEEALKAAAQALNADRRYRPAQIVQANALYALRQFEGALYATRNLYREAPADIQTLLLHAKTTHAVHSYQEEIEVLQRMIGLMKGRSQPVGMWQIYLGQAYAALGGAVQAADQFKAALSDPTLPEAEQAFARKAIERVEAKTDMFGRSAILPKSSLLDAP